MLRKKLSLALALLILLSSLSIMAEEVKPAPSPEEVKLEMLERYEELRSHNKNGYTGKTYSTYRKILDRNRINPSMSLEEIGARLEILEEAENQLESRIKSNNNEFRLASKQDFQMGTFSSTEISNKIGQGALVLESKNGVYKNYGEYLSPLIDVADFEDLVLSWNSNTPPATSIELEARVLVKHFDQYNRPIQTWSQWFSWGRWSPFIERYSSSSKGELARISTDTLSTNGVSGEVASRVQVRVKLYSEDKSLSPSLGLIHGSMKNSINPIGKKFQDLPKEGLDKLDKIIDTPMYSQMVTNPSTHSKICSPTTITMLLNRMGEDLIPDELAQNTYDSQYGFGNWSFAVANAGAFGYESYVDFTNLEGLKREIYKGYPVGVSVRYTNKENDEKNPSLPYLENSPGVTYGHLIVVKGFTSIDGVDYVVVNDSYGADNSQVERFYRLDQFLEAWSNRAAYIVHDKVKDTGFNPIERLESSLEKTSQPHEYRLIQGGKSLDLSNFGGVIAYTIDGENYSFISNKDKPSLTLDQDLLANKSFQLHVITDTGYIYYVGK